MVASRQLASVAGMVLLLLASALSTGCATRDAKPQDTEREMDIEPTVVGYDDYRDPLIHLNRAVFRLNDVTYRYALIPLSEAYNWGVPDPVKSSIGNFFYNIKMPIYFVNHLFQLQPEGMGRNLLRFVINSTVGLAGLFDPAAAWFELERAPTTFGDTLEGYGVGYGIYIVLPLLGPSDARAGTSLVVDYFLNPVPYLLDQPESTAVMAVDSGQRFASEAPRYLILREKAEDPYLFFRNLHLQGQLRNAEY